MGLVSWLKSTFSAKHVKGVGEEIGGTAETGAALIDEAIAPSGAGAETAEAVAGQMEVQKGREDLDGGR